MNESASKLREYRKRLNLTQKGLAQGSGISQQVISKYENGTRTPKFEIVCALAAFLQVSVSEISDYKDEAKELDKKTQITKQQLLEETAQFVGGITRKYEIYSDTFSMIAKALNAIAGE